jgi:two-component system, chemotaxis family, response regulator Rcp1
MSDKKKILLVEDRESDARLVIEAFKGVCDKCEFDVVKDGESAINYLAKKEKAGETNAIDLIILDIKLPKKDGKEVLKEIKSSVTLDNVPVIMLTNSDSKEDIQESYEHKANAYITKPLAMQDLIETAKYIKETWMKGK